MRPEHIYSHTGLHYLLAYLSRGLRAVCAQGVRIEKIQRKSASGYRAPRAALGHDRGRVGERVRDSLPRTRGHSVPCPAKQMLRTSPSLACMTALMTALMTGLLWVLPGSIAHGEKVATFSPSTWCAAPEVERNALRAPLVRWRSAAQASDRRAEAARCAAAIPRDVDLCAATGHAWLLSELLAEVSETQVVVPTTASLPEPREEGATREPPGMHAFGLEPRQDICLRLRLHERGINIASDVKRISLDDTTDIWRLSELFWRHEASRPSICSWLPAQRYAAEGAPWARRLVDITVTYCAALEASESHEEQPRDTFDVSLPPTAAMALLDRTRLEETAAARLLRQRLLAQDNPHVQRAALRANNVTPRFVTQGFPSVRTRAACLWLKRNRASRPPTEGVDWRAVRLSLPTRHRLIMAECAAEAGACNLARLLVGEESTEGIQSTLKRCSPRGTKDPMRNGVD